MNRTLRWVSVVLAVSIFSFSASGCDVINGLMGGDEAAQAQLEAEKKAAEDAKKAEEAKEKILADAKLEPMMSPMYYKNVEQVKAYCDEGLAKAKAIVKAIKSVEGDRNVDNTLKRFNDLYMVFNRVMGVNGLMAQVHPVKEVREASDTCSQEVAKAMDEVRFDVELYQALKAVKVDALDEATKRFVFLLDRDYRLSGIDKDDETRAKLKALSAELVKTSQEFSNNYRESKLEVKVKAKALKGMPKDFLASHKADDKGMVTLTTDYPDYFPVMNYARSGDVRRDLTIAFNNRAYPQNKEVLLKLIKLRAEYAKLLGYETWADYAAVDKMTKKAEVIEKFLKDLAEITKPRSDADVKAMLKLKKKDQRRAKKIELWDRFYYKNKITEKAYDIDGGELRKYFPYAQVQQGLFDTVEKLYNVKIVERDAGTWHEDVKAYSLMDAEGKKIGDFYLDMHPRDGKYQHAAMFDMISGIPGVQVAAATLVCNFPKPSEEDPGYMEFSQVRTFFHEFGHLLHHLFSSKHAWINQAGIATEWDFVEAPSQMFEQWVYNYDVLKTFAKDAKGKVIDEKLVKKLKDSEAVALGIDTMRQLFLASLSFELYRSDPDKLDLDKMMADLYAKYMPFPFFEKEHMYASFGHLDGYSSIYYTYQWSLAISKDLLSKFMEKGLMDAETAKRYHDAILAAGGSKDAAELVKDFLGRDYNLDAYKAFLSGDK